MLPVSECSIRFMEATGDYELKDNLSKENELPVVILMSCDQKESDYLYKMILSMVSCLLLVD